MGLPTLGRALFQLTLGDIEAENEGHEPLTPGLETAYIVISITLVALAGLMSGLTLGLMSLDKVDIEVIKRSGTEKQKWLVERIEPVLSHPHHLLVTLLLTNAVAMEALPIFLDRLLNPLAAILISVTAVLFFGEIIPQSICKRYGLHVGAHLAWLVRGLMFITAPISWPTAKLLDWLLGEETALFRRAELKALVSFHAEPQDDGGMSTLTQDEVAVIQGALDMATKTAQAAMTPLEKVFMLPADSEITHELLRQVIDRGHSRVPVFEGSRQNLIGLILVKELVLADAGAGARVRDLRLREVPFLRADTPLFDILKIFRTGRSHMAVLTRVGRPPGAEEWAAAPYCGGSVHGGSIHGGNEVATSSLLRRQPSGYALPHSHDDPQQEAIGIITIEDVLEELLQQEIVDETDRFVDNLQTVRTTTLLSLQHLPPNLRKFLTRTFRVNSPVNRAAFQAALAAQSPFASTSPSAQAGAGGGGSTPGDPLSAAPSAVTSPEKQVAYAAAVAAAAAAAAAAEEAAAAGGGAPLQLVPSIGSGPLPAPAHSGPHQPLLVQSAQLQQQQQQQQQSPLAPRREQQRRASWAPPRSPPPPAGTLLRGAAGCAPDEVPLLRGHHSSLASGGGQQQMTSPLKPPLPRLLVKTAPPPDGPDTSPRPG